MALLVSEIRIGKCHGYETSSKGKPGSELSETIQKFELRLRFI